MARVGIIGAGQLGQMLGIAGRNLGVECVFLDPAAAPPAAAVGRVIRKPFDDPQALRELAGNVQALTYEFENVPVAGLQEIAAQCPVQPPLAALHEAQDRAREKRLFERLDIPLPAWRTIDSEADLRAAADAIGLPLVVKTRRFGYDGKGQVVVHGGDDFAPALERLPNRPLIAEQWVAFDREVSAIGARRADGELAVYPLTENDHRGGILRLSRAPAGPPDLAERAAGYLATLMNHLDYVGVLALEFFVVGDTLLANEFAPRVHNSGHWTIEGATTSQFENHLRAVLDLPLGSPAAVAHAGMLNLIGAMPSSPATLADAGCFVHDYGKSPRRGRKLGHITVIGNSPDDRDRRLAQLDAMLAS